MKILEKIFYVFSFIGLAFLLLNYPFSVELLIMFLSSLALLYMGLSFYIFEDISIKNVFKRKTYSRKALKISLSFVFGYSLAILIIGILFKLMIWPYSNTLIVFGLLSVFAGLVLSIYKYSKTNDSFYKRILIRTFFWFIVGIFVFNLSKYDLIEYKYKKYPKYIESYKNYLDNPNEENEKIMLQERELMQKN